jgi:hypothetical protein
MKTQHVFSASAAAVLVVSMAAFAQTPQSASPSTQSSTPSSQATSPSTPSGQQSTTQASSRPETSVTLVGCVMRETDYRKAKDSGKGGPVGTGIGRGDEFVLTNATKTTAGATTSSSTAECGTAAAGEAYELGGSREKDLASYVGRRVEITGTLKEAKTETATTGEAKPTGGFDPLKQDLKLFEVDIVSFRPVASSQSAAAPAPTAAAQSPASPAPEPPAAAAAQPAPAPRPASPATPPSQQSAPAAPRENLPRTASPLPVTALFGLLSMATGLMLRRRG